MAMMSFFWQKGHGFIYSEVEHVVDVEFVVPYFEYLCFETLAFALFADQVDVGQELHFYGDVAIAFAGLAAASFYVEGKVFGVEATYLGKGLIRIHLTDAVISFDIGHRIGSRRLANGCLVDHFYAGYHLEVAHQLVVFAWRCGNGFTFGL